VQTILWLLLTLNPRGAVDVTCVKHILVPRYPRLARIAQFQGTVTVNIQIGIDGTVVSAASSGPDELLRRASEENAKHWTFCPAQDATPRKHTITYVYKLEGPKEYYDSPPIVTIDLPDRVEIIGNPPEPMP
jgi:TonB family protein